MPLIPVFWVIGFVAFGDLFSCETKFNIPDDF